jgi:hypothetical protein
MPAPFQVENPQTGAVLLSVDYSGNVQAAGTIGGIPAAGSSTAPITFADTVNIHGGDPAGLLNITQSVATVTNPGTISQQEAAATNGAYAIFVSGDASARFSLRADGQMRWGPGNAGLDTTLARSAAGVLAVTTGSFDVSTAGQGLRVAEGSNAKQGTATLTAGAVTVANTSVTATSRIFLTSQADGGTPGFLRVSTRTAGTSFTITSSSGTDTSTVAYEIFEVG